MKTELIYYISLAAILSALTLGVVCVVHGINGIAIKSAYGVMGVAVGACGGFRLSQKSKKRK